MSDRLLFLERFLAENTDEETFVSTGEIVAAYEQNGFGNNRNNVKADLNRLRETGIKIGEKQEKNTKYYHIADRPFFNGGTAHADRHRILFPGHIEGKERPAEPETGGAGDCEKAFIPYRKGVYRGPD